jgi:hypothetical protein
MLALYRFQTPFEVVEYLLRVSHDISARENIINTPQSVVYDVIKSGLQHGDMPATSLLTALKVSLMAMTELMPVSDYHIFWNRTGSKSRKSRYRRRRGLLRDTQSPSSHLSSHARPRNIACTL